MEDIEIGAGGTSEIRTVCSGLVGKVPIEEMTGQVIVVCNLKARNMKGIKSAAMVLAAVGTQARGAFFGDPATASTHCFCSLRYRFWCRC